MNIFSSLSKRIALVLLGFGSYYGSAQITINNTLYTTTQLVNGVLVPTGSGTNVSNVNFRGVYNVSSKYQVGYFTTAGPTLPAMGFSSGIFLTTGNTSTVPLTLGTNPGSVGQMATSYTSGTAGEIRSSNPVAGQDADAQVLITPYNYYNAAILEFDFVPVTNSVSFRYIFASEEYNDESGSAFAINYNCSAYNDKFAFLISGPGIAGGLGYLNNAKNIARLANGSEVGINSVNDGIVGSSGSPQNASLCTAENPGWVNNTATPEFLGFINGTQFNGNTRILTATQSGLTPGATYHIRLLVADANDATYDSGVYLEAGSFTTQSTTANAGPNQSVCTTSASLNATAPATGTWTVISGTGTFSNVTSPTSSVTGLSAGANIFQWSDGTNFSSVTITANAPPTVTSTSSGNLTCTTTSTTLTGTSAGNTMLWNGGALTNATNPASVTAAGTYTVTSTNGTTSCSNTSSITITSNTTPPTLTSASSGNITCTATSAALTGTSAGNTMVWNGGTLTNAANPATVSTTGTYTVTATDATNGCTNTSNVTITSNTTPPTVASASSGNLTCTTTSATLTGTSAGNTMVWNGGALTNAANPATVITAGTYTITATDATNGCTNTSTVTINSNTTPPTLTSASSGNLTCATTNATLTGTSAGNTMVWNGGTLTNAANPATVSTTGTYTVTATDATNGCTSTSTVTVTSTGVFPNISIAAPLQITCTSATTILMGNSTTTNIGYQWTSGPAAANYTVSAAGPYTLTVTDLGTGCTSQQTVNVTSNTTPPTVTSASSGNLTCTATIATLTGTSMGNTMVWNGGILTNATNPTTVATAGTYTVTATDATNGCINTSQVIVTSNTIAPTVTSASSGNITCTNANATLTGTSSGNTMVWNGGALTNAANPATATAAGTYTVTATNPANGCTATSTVNITSNTTVPNLTAGSPAIISCVTGTANITAASSTSGITYNWTGPGITAGGTTSSATVNVTGTYTITVTDPTNGCTSTSTVIVGANTPPVADAGTDITIASGTSATLTATGGVTYLWNNGETTNPILVSPTVTTNYCVTANDALGCSDTACVTVTVDIQCGELFVPTAFSPNGDGVNDVFRVKVNPICVKEMSLLVFDRWGEKIIEITDPGQSWDGTYKGKALDNAVFVYYLAITLINSTETIKKIGNVSLLK